MRPPPLLRAACRLAGARPEARRFAVRAWLAAPLVQASLALAGLQATLRWVEAVPRARGRAAAGPVGVDEGSALVRGAFRVHVVGGECLPQSVVQYLLHRRDGTAARMVVGVKRPEGGASIAAHAWVEAAEAGHDGRAPQTGSRAQDPAFAPLFATGPAARGAA
jgi:hypothetical protein